MAYYGNQPIAGETNSFKVLDDISSYTKTFDGSSAAVVSTSDDTLTFYDHRFIQGQRVTYGKGSGGTVVTGLTDATVYYVIRQDKDTIQLATSASNAATLTAVDLTGVGGGTSHELTVAFDGTNTKFKATTGGGTHIKLTRPGQLMISMNGVVQEPQNNTPTNGFGIESNNVIVFSTAPTVLDTFWGHYLTSNLSSWEMSDNKIDNFTGNGSTTTYTLSKTPANADNILVTIDGVTQYPSDSATTRAYTLNASVVTFTTAPTINAAIAVRHIGYAGGSGGGSGGGGVTGFYGRTGNVSVIRSDLQNTDINLKNLTGVAATFTGNVSIAGTLTYTDVTNIDSIGIVTAQSGVHFGIGATSGKFEAATGITTFSTSVGIADSIHHVGNTDTSIRFPADDTFTVETAGDERFRINSSGQVAIGTASNAGSSSLHIHGGGASDKNHIRLTADRGLIARLGDTSGSAQAMFDLYDTDGSTQILRFISGGGDNWINTGGDLGIGTDNPKKTLNVFAGVGTTELIRLSQPVDSSVQQNFGIGWCSNNNHTWPGALITSQEYDVSDPRRHLLFYTRGLNSDTAPIERLRITSDGKTFIHGDGATGANNTSTLLPNGYTLNIHGTSSNDGISVVRYNASYGAYGLNIGKSNNSTFGTNTLVTDNEELGHISFYGADGTDFNMAAQITGEVDGTPSDGTDMPGALVFKTSAEASATPTERLRITSGGKFGFNDDNPERTVDVKGSNCMIQLEGTGGSGRQYSLCSTDNATGAAVGPPGQFVIYDDTAGADRFSITSSGNIGIARTDPNQMLCVNGNIETNAHDNSNGNGGYYTAKGLIIGNAYDASITGLTDDRNAIIWQERGLDLDFGTNNTFRMKIDYNGNIGINTTLAGSQTWRSGRRLEIFGGEGNVTGEIHLGAIRSDANQSVGSVNFFDNGQDTSHKQIALIEADKAGSTSNKRGGDLIFFTKPDNIAAPAERLRIDSKGSMRHMGTSGYWQITVIHNGSGSGNWYSGSAPQQIYPNYIDNRTGYAEFYLTFHPSTSYSGYGEPTFVICGGDGGLKTGGTIELNYNGRTNSPSNGTFRCYHGEYSWQIYNDGDTDQVAGQREINRNVEHRSSSYVDPSTHSVDYVPSNDGRYGTNVEPIIDQRSYIKIKMNGVGSHNAIQNHDVFVKFTTYTQGDKNWFGYMQYN